MIPTNSAPIRIKRKFEFRKAKRQYQTVNGDKKLVKHGEKGTILRRKGNLYQVEVTQSIKGQDGKQEFDTFELVNVAGEDLFLIQQVSNQN